MVKDHQSETVEGVVNRNDAVDRVQINNTRLAKEGFRKRMWSLDTKRKMALIRETKNKERWNVLECLKVWFC